MVDIFRKIYKNNKSKVLLLSIMTVIISILGIGLPYLNGKFIDTLINLKEINQIIKLISLIIILGGLNIVFNYIYQIVSSKLIIKSIYDLRIDILKHLRKIPILQYKEFDPVYMLSLIHILCVKNVFAIWDKTKENKSTQLLFSDMSTPKGDGEFNIYDDIREKLVAMGIPKEEIAFIHEANSDKQKDELFAKVRKGEIRILMGSTQKMGAGTNVQNKLIALHDLDVPWRPADLEQRAGRIVRQGNENKEVNIYRYVTENTFCLLYTSRCV